MFIKEKPHKEMMKSIDDCIYEYYKGSKVIATIKLYKTLLYTDIDKVIPYYDYWRMMKNENKTRKKE